MRIGIDLGGTKIEIIALGDDGRELLRRRIPTPQADYPRLVAAIVHLISEAERELGQFGSIGIGIPGAESEPGGPIKNANSTCLIGQALRQDLQICLQRQIHLANDANCFALSEAIDGSGRHADIVFGVILGTGVGGGIVINRQVLEGANAISGEWGHNPLPAGTAEDLPRPDCYCGRQGCIESYLSGPGLAHDHFIHSGEHLAPAQIDQLAQAGNAACEASLRRYEYRLGRALASVINILDPHVIVLGGGLSNLQRLYRNLPEACAPHIFSDQIKTKFRPPAHGDSSGVRGAAWLWP